jgi:hypothetical protein
MMRETRDLEDSNTKNQPWDQSQPWECLQNPRHSHATWFDFQFFFLIFTRVSVHRQRLPHLKCESEGTFSPSPTPGHSRYVTI